MKFKCYPSREKQIEKLFKKAFQFINWKRKYAWLPTKFVDADKKIHCIWLETYWERYPDVTFFQHTKRISHGVWWEKMEVSHGRYHVGSLKEPRGAYRLYNKISIVPGHFLFSNSNYSEYVIMNDDGNDFTIIKEKHKAK